MNLSKGDKSGSPETLTDKVVRFFVTPFKEEKSQVFVLLRIIIYNFVKFCSFANGEKSKPTSPVK